MGGSFFRPFHFVRQAGRTCLEMELLHESDRGKWDGTLLLIVDNETLCSSTFCSLLHNIYFRPLRIQVKTLIPAFAAVLVVAQFWQLVQML